MATVRAFIRTSSTKRKNEPSAAVRFRLCDGRARQLFYTSEIMVDPAAWDAKRECLKSKMMDSIERIKTSRMIANRKNLILELYDSIADKSNVTSEDLELLIDKALHPDNYEVEEIIEEKLQEIDERDAEIIRMRYGLADHKPHTLQQIADHFHLTKEGVRQKLMANLQKLRKSENLAVFLENMNDK